MDENTDTKKDMHSLVF